GLVVVFAEHCHRQRDLHWQSGVDSSARPVNSGNFGMGTLASGVTRGSTRSIFYPLGFLGDRERDFPDSMGVLVRPASAHLEYLERIVRSICGTADDHRYHGNGTDGPRRQRAPVMGIMAGNVFDLRGLSGAVIAKS